MSSAAVVVVIALSTTGCADSGWEWWRTEGSTLDQPIIPSTTPTPTPTYAGPVPSAGAVSVASGAFESQWTATEGTITFSSLDGRVSMQLEGFTTGEGGDLRLHVNEGELITGMGGFFTVDDGERFDFGPLVSTDRGQLYDVTEMAADGWLARMRSVTIWDATTSTAWGSAAVGPFYG